jgi:hypothetical protein
VAVPVAETAAVVAEPQLPAVAQERLPRVRQQPHRVVARHRPPVPRQQAHRLVGLAQHRPQPELRRRMEHRRLLAAGAVLQVAVAAVGVVAATSRARRWRMVSSLRTSPRWPATRTACRR